MPRRNRVTPLGDIVAHPARGLVFGNRGCLHDDDGRIRRRHAGRRWIACRLSFKDRRRELMAPGRYTELFFLDDATALAAGHRPCAECRREDYEALRRRRGRQGRRAGRARRRSTTGCTPSGSPTPGRSASTTPRSTTLPDGAFVLRDDAPWLVRGDELLRWTPAGYAGAVGRPAGVRTVVVTPPSLVAVLERGWRPAAVALLHPSAGAR